MQTIAAIPLLYSRNRPFFLQGKTPSTRSLHPSPFRRYRGGDRLPPPLISTSRPNWPRGPIQWKKNILYHRIMSKFSLTRLPTNTLGHFNGFFKKVSDYLLALEYYKNLAESQKAAPSKSHQLSNVSSCSYWKTFGQKLILIRIWVFRFRTNLSLSFVTIWVSVWRIQF